MSSSFIWRASAFWSALLLIIACSPSKGDSASPVLAQGLKSTPSASEHAPTPVDRDWDSIASSGVLRAILTFSAHSYFIYKGAPMGYEYELVSRLADQLGLTLEVIVAEDMDRMADMLNRGEGDLIAHGLTITRQRKEKVAFTKAHSTTQQVLVQRLPENWRQLKRHQIDNRLIRSSLDLENQTVSVRAKSAYHQRLLNIQDEIGGTIHIDTVDGSMTTDEIIASVAEGDLSFTVADKNIAQINETFYGNLDIQTTLSLEQRLAWAVRKSSPVFLEKINSWIAASQKEADYFVIYNKYFKNKKAFRQRAASDFYSKNGGKISPYDSLIQHYAENLQWDWRLLAAQVYQESQFDPKNTSWAGARGLLQLMPGTARQFGVQAIEDPADNLRGGTSYLAYLTDFWENIPDSLERTKFILASFNAGPGHVQDARALAEKNGANPDIWDGSVEKYLLLKARPEFYNDDVVKYGYCRGAEPVQYVSKILDRYQQYQLLINA